jgi:hypothetical protein
MKQNENLEISSFTNENLNKNLFSQKSITCWNCSFFFKCDISQPVVLCPNCNKYNRVPKGGKIPPIPLNNFSNIYNIENNSINNNNNNNNILICPYCFTKNLFESNADELICYKCSRKIKSDNINDTHELITERGNGNIIGWKLVPNAQYIDYPRTPIAENSNTDYLLKKILKSIKKQNNKEFNPYPAPMYSPYIPYPVFDYFNERRNFSYSNRYDDDSINRNSREIRYIPIKTETETVKEKNVGYKITIRKRNKKKNGLAKSTVFEKVFYLNK